MGFRVCECTAGLTALDGGSGGTVCVRRRGVLPGVDRPGLAAPAARGVEPATAAVARRGDASTLRCNASISVRITPMLPLSRSFCATSSSTCARRGGSRFGGV